MSRIEELKAIEYSRQFLESKLAEIRTIEYYDSKCVLLLNTLLIDLKIRVKKLEGGK